MRANETVPSEATAPGSEARSSATTAPAGAGGPGSRRQADTAGRVARDWVSAWTTGDLDSVRTILATDATVESNLGWPLGRDHLLDLLQRLAQRLESVALLSLTAGADRAALLYDCRTREPAGTIRLAEFLEVSGAQVTGVRRVYDLTAVDVLLPDLRHRSAES
ncbi:MAG TPA: nuclear transport factor 2 family protein [Micromonosporaceae bacterium]|nr:nuclear transport factor 2 family protein [Micromonosporaceae bacterium]